MVFFSFSFLNFNNVIDNLQLFKSSAFIFRNLFIVGFLWYGCIRVPSTIVHLCSHFHYLFAKQDIQSILDLFFYFEYFKWKWPLLWETESIAQMVFHFFYMLTNIYLRLDCAITIVPSCGMDVCTQHFFLIRFCLPYEKFNQTPKQHGITCICVSTKFAKGIIITNICCSVRLFPVVLYNMYATTLMIASTYECSLVHCQNILRHIFKYA